MRVGYPVETVKRAEAALLARLPAGELMQRAAAGLAASCVDLLGGSVYGRRVVLLAGTGDNGGDALYAGARLAGRGAQVHAVLLDPGRAHPAGLDSVRVAGGRVLPAELAAPLLGRADLVVDGIVGIGAAGPLRAGAASLVELLAGSPAAVVAVDIPSGVDPDTGAVPGPAVWADLTVTFGAVKPGLLVDPGATHAGVVQLVDIGLEPYLAAHPGPAVEALQAADVGWLLPLPSGPAVDKYRRGVIGVVAGSPAYPGAAVLAVGGALRGGAGMVRYVGPDRVRELVHARWPEAVGAGESPAAAGRVQAWVVGPGLGTDQVARRKLDEVLDSDLPVLADADALSLLAGRGNVGRAAPTLLTPHAGEAARLLGHDDRAGIEAHRLEAARAVAARYKATVLLKGTTTVVAEADPARPARVNPTGTPWLATAGSGDVLSGLAGSLLAAGLDPLDAGSVGAYLHGLAARLAAADGIPITASDVLAALPTAWRELT